MVHSLGRIKGSLLVMTVLAYGGISNASGLDSALADYGKWSAQSRVLDDSVKEMEKFGINNAANIAETLHARIANENLSSITKLTQGNCVPSQSVDFIGGDDKDFNAGLVRIEAVACLPSGRAEAALSVYFSPEFRRVAVPELTDSQLNGSLLCEQTKSIPLLIDATRACQLLENHNFGEIQAVQASLDSNANGFSPFYFREAIVTAIETTQGLRMHILAYAKQKQTISSFLRGIARSRIQTEQAAAFVELGRRISH